MQQGLSHLVFPEEVVQFRGGQFTVRGLSLEHISAIIRLHGPRLESLFQQFKHAALMQGGENPQALELASYITPLLQEAPDIAACMIAYAAGEANPSLAARLPFPTQADALEKILDLTFDEEGGPGKLLETVIRLAQGATGLVSQATAHLSQN
ncbi:tail protein [Bacteriophage Phobos]|uniref:Tail protein n=1 Tax=Bacteriophage Phobos TaxID=2662138 RepID=A0A5Q2UCD2_9CAUD|nr:tail protein [Bacteriophage Phobos]QGH44999.1 tail protein [Bacteriophage Phobos]WPK42395.1 tail protein [Pseudomonas phage Ppu-503]